MFSIRYMYDIVVMRCLINCLYVGGVLAYVFFSESLCVSHITFGRIDDISIAVSTSVRWTKIVR